MKYLIRRFLFYGISLTFLATCCYGIIAGPENLSGGVFEEGLRTLDGVPIDNPSKVLQDDTFFAFIIAWKLGCEACDLQLEELRRIDGIQGVEVITINIGGSENDVRKYEEEYPFIFLVGATQPPDPAIGVPQTALYGYNIETNRLEMIRTWLGYQKEPIDTFLDVINEEIDN